MFWRTKKKLDQIHSAVEDSFSRVRSDTTILFEWIRFLHEQLEAQKRALHTQQSLMSSGISEGKVRDLIDLHAPRLPDVKPLHEKVQGYDVRLAQIEQALERIAEQAKNQASMVVVDPMKVRQTRLQEKIVRSVNKQSKEYIKKTILSLLEKYDQISASALREMVVDEQLLCSRSSFYRCIDELREQGELDAVSSGKEKVLARNRKVFK